MHVWCTYAALHVYHDCSQLFLSNFKAQWRHLAKAQANNVATYKSEHYMQRHWMEDPWMWITWIQKKCLPQESLDLDKSGFGRGGSGLCLEDYVFHYPFCLSLPLPCGLMSTIIVDVFKGKTLTYLFVTFYVFDFPVMKN